MNVSDVQRQMMNTNMDQIPDQTLQICRAFSAERDIGWTVCVVDRSPDQPLYLPIVNVYDLERAEVVVDEIRRFLLEWELLYGVQRTFADLGAVYAAGNGLSMEWRSINDHLLFFSNQGLPRLKWPRGFMFRSLEGKLHRGVRNPLYSMDLLSPYIADARQAALSELSEEVGHSVSDEEASVIAEKWGVSRVSRALHVDLVLAANNDGELIGFLVVAYKQIPRKDKVWLQDLSEPFSHEVGARFMMGTILARLEAIRRVPYHPAHRDGLGKVLEEIRRFQHADPFSSDTVSCTDLRLLLSWASVVRRSSISHDGGVRYMETADEIFSEVPIDQVAVLEWAYGCQYQAG